MRMCRETCLAAQESCDLTFHCVSRVVDRAFKLGPREKSTFVKMMREYESFCGVEVLTFCIMSNHIHLLVRVPKTGGDEITDEQLLERLSYLYDGYEVALVEKSLKKYRKNHATKAARELRERYTYRMGDISEFMKSLKQKFTRWYNKTHARTGTLWEDRYSVTMVGDGWATKVTAAYIDLNPLRAGMVSDPKDYRWSGYGEAVGASGKRNVDGSLGLAKRRLLSVMQAVEPGARAGSAAPQNEAEAMQQYRVLLSEEGEAETGDVQLGQKASVHKKRQKGFSKKQVEKILKDGGELSLAEMLRCKTRYFTDGFAIGSKQFVDDVLGNVKAKTGKFTKRKSGGCKIKHGSTQVKDNIELPLYSFRRLRKAIIE